MSRAITGKDVASAFMGGAGTKKIRVAKMPPTRPAMCDGCPFGPNIRGLMLFQCAVLKDELRARPNALWMCHETADGGARPTEKSIICKGFADWRASSDTNGHSGGEM